MNVSEILITVGLTVAAAAVIAYTTFKLQARHREKALFRALQSEFEINKIKLDTFIKDWSMYYWEKTDYDPEAPILFTEAYEALRLSGDLLKLPVAVRNRLNNTLSLIAIYNLRVSEAELDYSRAKGREEQFRPRMNGILKHLKVPENELGKGVQKATERSDYAQESLLPRYMIYYVASINLFLFWSAFDIRVLFSGARY